MKEKNINYNMNLFRYSDFVAIKPINENLDKTRKFLKETELIKMAANQLRLISKDMEYELKSGEKKVLTLNDFDEEDKSKIKQKIREISLSEEQLKKLEQNPDFVKLRELLKDNLGYLYNFVYMFFVENTPFEDIKEIYARVIDYKQILDKMAEYQRVGKKFDANFIDPNINNNSEILIDGLNYLEDYKMVKKVIDTFTSKLKKAWQNATELQKEEMAAVAREFANVSEDKREKVWSSFFGELRLETMESLPNGSPNPNYNKMVWSSSLKRFENMENPIRELIKAAKNHLKSSENDNILNFYNKIAECNHKYGSNGADILFDQNGILILNVKSFQANVLLNGNTRHCIKDTMSQWDGYVANHPNMQYYIYNFNIPQTDNLSVIGVTIEPGYKIRAAHRKDDGSISSTLKDILHKWEKQYNLNVDLFKDFLKPMNPEEVERRKRAKEAERKIVEKGITIDQIKEYVTVYGANINKDNAKVLSNAVEEDDIEKVKYVLSLGAEPNLGGDENLAISKAKNLDMIKLLVSNGSDMVPSVFKNIAHDSEAVEYCLKAGMDPNFNTSMPFRTTLKGTYKGSNDLGEPYFDSFIVLLNNGAKIHDSAGKNMLLRWVADYGRIEVMKYIVNEKKMKFKKKEWEDALKWILPRRMEESIKSELVSYIEDRIEESEV
jgi:hypothetical protein